MSAHDRLQAERLLEEAVRATGHDDLGEPTYCSPAFSNGQIFLRTTKAIYAIGKAKQ